VQGGTPWRSASPIARAVGQGVEQAAAQDALSVRKFEINGTEIGRWRGHAHLADKGGQRAPMGPDYRMLRPPARLTPRKSIDVYAGDRLCSGVPDSPDSEGRLE